VKPGALVFWRHAGGVAIGSRRFRADVEHVRAFCGEAGACAIAACGSRKRMIGEVGPALG
jgi:hypothetical protein